MSHPPPPVEDMSHLPMPPASPHTQPCNDVTRLAEKVAALEQWRQETEDYGRIREKVQALETWRVATEADLKAIHDVVSQVKLLMSLSIGGGGLSILTLIITLILLVTGNK